MSAGVHEPLGQVQHFALSGGVCVWGGEKQMKQEDGGQIGIEASIVWSGLAKMCSVAIFLPM